MRISSYAIMSDPLPDGTRVLMNGISGALDLISDRSLAATLSQAMTATDNEAFLGALDQQTIEEFVERGHLTELSKDAEKRIVVVLAEDAHQAMLRRPSFMIVPNLDCNYRCTYCFERPLQNTLKSTGADISHLKGNVVIRPEQIGWIYDAISSLRAEARLEDRGQIILYGGEPLDGRNYEVVSKIIEEGMARNNFFAVITNGHDLDAYLHYLGTGKIEQVQVSVDGPKAVHDKRRIYVGKDSSYDRIMHNMRRVIAETDAQLQLRVHVDPSNISLFAEVIDAFEVEGWLGSDRVIIYGNTVYERTATGGVHARMDHGEIDAMLAAQAARAPNIHTSAPEIHASRSVQPALVNGERFQLKGTYCSANSGNYIFAPDGAVYACWESVGKSCSRIGRYGPRGVALEAAAADRWFKRSIATLPPCQDCAFALTCGGGCAQYAEYEKGTLYESYCDDFQRTFRSALARAVSRGLASPSSIARVLPVQVKESENA